MAAFERSQKSTLLARLREKPARLIVVVGPRQTGKTTLIRQVLGDIERPHRYLAVDEPDPETLTAVPGAAGEAGIVGEQATMPLAGARNARWLVRQWERARIEADSSERGFVLVFDGIQEVAGWSEAVKGMWDADRWHDRRLHVVLLASVPPLQHQNTTESLAGRFETVRLTHWSFPEMSEAFGVDLPGYVYFGGYPGAAPLVHDHERWREYITGSVIEPSIERDVLAMRQVDKPALMRRLFELGAGHSGRVLSYDRMPGHLRNAGNPTTLARCLELLSHGGLIAGLPNHANHVRRRHSSGPKLIVLDTALMSAGSGYTFEEARVDRSFWEQIVESAVGAHLHNTGRPALRLRYWRSEGQEVAFVLERGRRLVAFEIRSGGRRSARSGLRAFETRFDVEKSVLVGEGGIHLSEFLMIPAGEWFERP